MYPWCSIFPSPWCNSTQTGNNRDVDFQLGSLIFQIGFEGTAKFTLGAPFSSLVTNFSTAVTKLYKYEFKIENGTAATFTIYDAENGYAVVETKTGTIANNTGNVANYINLRNQASIGTSYLGKMLL